MEFYALVIDEGSLSALIDGELGELGRIRALNDHWLVISGVHRCALPCSASLRYVAALFPPKEGSLPKQRPATPQATKEI